MEFDFSTLWNIGLAVLSGTDPYLVPYSYYPPAAVYFLALLAVFPKPLAFVLFTGLGLGALLRMLYVQWLPFRSLAWLLYTPTIYIIGVGQLDLLYLGLYYFLEAPGWIAVLSAVLFTLKPQLAFITLPWFLLRWLRSDRKKLAAWFILCLVVHLLPLIPDPQIYQRWFASMQGIAGMYMDDTPGLFSLTHLNIPIIFLLVVAALVVFFGLRGDRSSSLIAQSLALPFGYWYNLVFLIGHVPWKILVPVSWLAFFLAYFVAHAFYPMILIPLSAYIWVLAEKYAQKSKGKILRPS